MPPCRCTAPCVLVLRVAVSSHLLRWRLHTSLNHPSLHHCSRLPVNGESVCSHTHTHTPRSKSGCGSQPKNQTAEFNTQNQMCDVDAPLFPAPHLAEQVAAALYNLRLILRLHTSSSFSFTTNLHRWNLLRGSAAVLMPR